MVRLDVIRKAFDSIMLDVFKNSGIDFQWLGVNANTKPDFALILVISGFFPGEVVSVELGGPEALASRDGVYIVTQSLPKDFPVDEAWKLAGDLERNFRRTRLNDLVRAVWCDEPYTENRGTEPETGRYLISTTIPWTMTS